MMNNVETPATRNRTRDHLIAAANYSQMLYQLSYSRLDVAIPPPHCIATHALVRLKGNTFESSTHIEMTHIAQPPANSGWPPTTTNRIGVQIDVFS